MSVDVMETTDGIASSAMSANEGRLRLAARTRPAGASRWASERGVTLTDPATTIPNTTAAAIKTEKDKALLVDFCIRVISPRVPGTGRGTSGATSRLEFEFLSGPHPFVPPPFDQEAPIHRHGNPRRFQAGSRVPVNDALLHEKEADAAADRLVGDRAHLG